MYSQYHHFDAVDVPVYLSRCCQDLVSTRARQAFGPLEDLIDSGGKLVWGHSMSTRAGLRSAFIQWSPTAECCRSDERAQVIAVNNSHDSSCRPIGSWQPKILVSWALKREIRCCFRPWTKNESMVECYPSRLVRCTDQVVPTHSLDMERDDDINPELDAQPAGYNAVTEPPRRE